jgi:hypothetical protein
LLDWLAADFAANRHDVRRFIRGVVLSRAYGLESADVAPETFAGAIERPLSAEQIARSWRIAAGLPSSDDALRRAVISAMPDVMPREYNASFQQAQFLTNAPAFSAVLKTATGGTVERIAALPDADARVREAFVAVFGREPDAEESTATAAFLKERADRPADGLRDLMWALMTSAEFLSMP